MDAYQRWWDTEGSAMRPHKHEDLEEFARRITEIAWSNGQFVEKEACGDAVTKERKPVPEFELIEKWEGE